MKPRLTSLDAAAVALVGAGLLGGALAATRPVRPAAGDAPPTPAPAVAVADETPMPDLRRPLGGRAPEPVVADVPEPPAHVEPEPVVELAGTAGTGGTGRRGAVAYFTTDGELAAARVGDDVAGGTLVSIDHGRATLDFGDGPEVFVVSPDLDNTPPDFSATAGDRGPMPEFRQGFE